MADYQTKMPEKNFKHTLSVIIPVYNEEKTILKLIDKVKSVKIKGVNKEIIVVDDYSSDGTRDVLKRLKDKSIKSVFHNKNWGKGKALKTGISSSSGDFIIFQDADLEYEPNDYKNIIKPLINGEADFVLGQRIFPKFFSKNNKVPMHILGNKIITLVGNTLYSTNLKDYEPCYKAFKSSLLKSINVEANDFNYDLELMAKLFRKGYKFKIVKISYKPRTREEGKKIRYKDGLTAILTLIKSRFKSLKN